MPALGDGGRLPRVGRRPQTIDPPELEPQCRQHLADVIVQLARQLAPLVFLRRHELLRQLAHLPFSILRALLLLLGAAFDDAQPDDGGNREQQAEQQRPPQQSIELGGERGLLPGDLGALRREVGVVQRFDLLRDCEHGVAARKHFAPEKAGAQVDLLGDRPVEERLEALPVVVELGLEAEDAAVVFAALPRDGRGARPA